MELTTKDKETVERLIDAYGLNDLLSDIGSICAEKAEHIQASYSDHVSADTWNIAATNMKIASEFAFSKTLTIRKGG